MAPQQGRKPQIDETNRKNPLHQEPTVINKKLIRKCLRALLPHGEEGLYARERGIDERTAEFLLIEFQSIAKISNISHMVALKKLQLSNNVIDEISGLDTLVNLTHLDLSYNCIKKIQNLDKLTKLELLNLHRNLITTIEGMDNQLRLLHFIISANGLHSKENLKYLRRLPRLKLLVIQGNPVCDEPNFHQYILAALPNLLVLDYQRVSVNDKLAAQQDKNLAKLARLGAIDAEARRASLVEAQAEEKVLYAKAHVDGFEDDELWNALYKDDENGQLLLQIPEIDGVRATYKELFRRASNELFKKGMAAFSTRDDEDKVYNIALKETKDAVKMKGQKLTEDFTDFGRHMMREMRSIVLILEEMERNRTINASAADEHNSMAVLEANKLQAIEKNTHEEKLHKLAIEFVRKLHEVWYTMMTEEIDLNEQILEVGQELGRALREHVVGWLEQVRGHFAQLREVQLQYNDRLVEALITYGEFRASDTSIPDQLRQLLGDKEALALVVQQSHEHHGMIIDQKEEALVTALKNWMESESNNIRINETQRSRRRICELSHYCDTQYAQLIKYKVLANVRAYVPDLRDDQDKIPSKWKKTKNGRFKAIWEKREKTEEKKNILERGSEMSRAKMRAIKQAKDQVL